MILDWHTIRRRQRPKRVGVREQQSCLCIRHHTQRRGGFRCAIFCSTKAKVFSAHTHQSVVSPLGTMTREQGIVLRKQRPKNMQCTCRNLLCHQALVAARSRQQALPKPANTVTLVDTKPGFLLHLGAEEGWHVCILQMSVGLIAGYSRSSIGERIIRGVIIRRTL